MNPIDANFNQDDVDKEKPKIWAPASNLIYVEINLGDAGLDEEFGQHGKSGVENHRGLGERNGIEHRRPLWKLSSILGENAVA